MRGRLVRVAQETEPFFSMCRCVSVQRRVVDSGRGARDLSVVGGTVKVDHMEAVLKEVDTGDEGFSLDSIAVEVIGVTIGCSDKDYPMGH